MNEAQTRERNLQMKWRDSRRWIATLILMEMMCRWLLADMWLNGGRGKYGGSGERMGKGRGESWEATKQKLIAGRWLNSPQLQTPHKSIFLRFCTNQYRGKKQIVLVSFVKNRPSNQLCTVQNILHISIKSIKKRFNFCSWLSLLVVPVWSPRGPPKWRMDGKSLISRLMGWEWKEGSSRSREWVNSKWHFGSSTLLSKCWKPLPGLTRAVIFCNLVWISAARIE